MEQTIGGLVERRLTDLAGAFLGYRESAAAAEDPECIHQMRVCARRIRALLRAFAAILPESTRAWEPGLAWIARSLGNVRDLDVLMERYPAARKDLEFRRSENLIALRLDLHSPTFDELRSSLTKFDSLPRNSLAECPVLVAAPDVLHRAYRPVRRLEIDKDSAPERVHKLRKRAKRLRYVADCFVDAYGKPADKFIGALKDLQDVLGAYQDAVIAAEIFSDLGIAISGPEPTSEGVSDLVANLDDRWVKLDRKAMKLRRSLWDGADNSDKLV